MGTGLVIYCGKCDYRKDFQVGIGMLHDPHRLVDLESESPILPSLIRSKKTLDQLRILLNNENVVVADRFGHYIYRCPSCNELYSRFFIHLEYPGGSFEPEYRCSKCKSILGRVNHNSNECSVEETIETTLVSFPCPKCESKSLHVDSRFTIMWD